MLGSWWLGEGKGWRWEGGGHGVGGGVEGERGMPVGSMNEESQVRGCFNITSFQPTRKQCLYWKRHKQTKHFEHKSRSED